jgi:hypothetical protein
MLSGENWRAEILQFERLVSSSEIPETVLDTHGESE